MVSLGVLKTAPKAKAPPKPNPIGLWYLISPLPIWPIKLVDEVPFQSAAIYQLTSRAKSAPLSKQQIDVVKREEEKKYDATTGIYYSIYSWSKNDVNPLTVGYLNLREDEDVRKYQKLMPRQQDIYGDIYNYRISDMKMKKAPKDAKPDNIITPENFEAFIKKEFE